MRFLLHGLLALATVATTYAIDTSDSLDEKEPDTIFNDQTVPPMKDLTGESIDQDISKGNWLVEFYSPYCGHCKAFKPTWQTLYEFYYTSKPVLSTNSDASNVDTLNSFTRYYDFKFARMSCTAYRDACSAKDINVYPSTVLFKDGKAVKTIKGGRTLEEMSNFVEEALETIRPGSRPQGGPKLPKVGASFVEPQDKKAAPETDVKEGTEGPSSTELPADKEQNPSKALEPEPTKPKSTSNPDGTSVPLTAEKFQKLVTNTLDPWFVKFYAPWCHHCQAMAPNWLQMAREMKGKLNVGEVNCDVEKRLCKDARVQGYPTLLFFRGGERVEYNGLRGIGDLIDFADKAVDVGSGVPDVDFDKFKKMEETEEVIFVYHYDHATTSEDFMALERLTLSLIGHAKLVKTKDPKLWDQFKISTWPRLMVSRDGIPTYYTPLAPKDIRDTKKVLNWMKSVWVPIVPELTSSNAREIMDGKIVVLGILNRERSSEFIIAKREMKETAKLWIERETNMFKLERQELRDAKQLRIEEAEDRNDQRALRSAKGIRINMDDVPRKHVGFAWVDGIFWERWVRTTYGLDVKNGEKVVINDEDNRRYWDVTINGEPIRISRTSILETISKVITSPPKITPKSTIGTFDSIMFHIRTACGSHPWLAFGVLLGFLFAGSMWGKSRIRRGRSFGNTGGFFQLNEKDGLLGGNLGGKVD
ncbi:thioredoxin-like protein [Delitschia confertaspora ATCC 74209]|uniref:Thioredoxin-like protein n=1 Tax=Delitschia confertaspora ATCC 74209 TaxID=1513339 RepID=A0A9P4MTW0_9PLEO|nr:thioredoxin-like protein [Delitschia confertaspora ATCC 74209]